MVQEGHHLTRKPVETYSKRTLVAGFDERRRFLDVIEYPLVVVVESIKLAKSQYNFMMLYSDDDSQLQLQVDAYFFRGNPNTYSIRTLVAGFDERRGSLDVIVCPLFVENRGRNYIM